MTRRVLTSLTILFLCALPLTREVRAEEHPADQQPAESKDTGSDESKDADDASADHSDEATAGDSEHAADASDTHAEQGDAAPDDSEHAAGEDSKHPAADQPIPVDAAQLEDLDKGAKTEGAPESEKSETGAKAVVGEPASLSTDSGQQRSTSQSDGAPTQQSAASESGSPSLDDREDQTIYRVVVNHEEQYSIWPNYKENALGWKDAGKTGTKAECLAYIKEVWTDMRPLSLRQKMEGAANGNP